MKVLDAIDRKLIAATQAGLPLASHPYRIVGEGLGLTESEVIERFRSLTASGVVRRIAAAPNHYKLGMTANGMTVWDVEDHSISVLGARVGALAFVSHCYRRPRDLPSWPYNLFAMVHGSSREEVEAKRGEIAALLGEACRASEILYSHRILKKTGLRLARERG